MTILAVVNGQIYADSHAVMEGLALSTNKVRSCELGAYAVAGNPAVATRHIGRFADLDFLMRRGHDQNL